MGSLTDSDIISRLHNTEDATVERKSAGDYRDVVRAATAFSNSMPLGEAAVIYVGVYDDGRIQDAGDLEKLQKKVSGEISNIYPPIYPQILVREVDGKRFIAIIVEGSPNRPHFAGKAYIRDGTQSPDASEVQFQELIAKRSSKTYEILKWVGQTVRVNTIGVQELVTRGFHRVIYSNDRTIVACNQFYVTVKNPHTAEPPEAITLKRIEISFDFHRQCLVLEISAV